MKYLFFALCVCSVACWDNYDPKKLLESVYDPAKDQDTTPDVKHTKQTPPDFLYHYTTHVVGSTGWSPLYHLKLEAFIDSNVSVTDVKVRQILSGDHPQSINNVLFQAGIVIDEVVIFRSTKPNASTYSYPNNFIFNKDGSEGLLLDSMGNPLNNSKGTHFRVGIHNTDGAGGRAAAYPLTNAFTFNSINGRNLIAHEIGHIFKLWHINDLFRGSCDFSQSYHRIMLNTIFDKSWRLVACEIGIMRGYSRLVVTNGNSWINTSGFSGPDATPPNIATLRANLNKLDSGIIQDTSFTEVSFQGNAILGVSPDEPSKEEPAICENKKQHEK